VARTELGWTPTVELRDGLARTFAHLRDENP
jgi:nucleoside-diphosphate-sugar epimerase